MSRADPRIVAALEKKTGLSRSQVNRRIAQAAREKHLTTPLAAILVGSENGVPVHRFASPEQLAELRGVPKSQPLPIPVPVRGANVAKLIKAKPTRDNSIFVVHGRDSQLTKDMHAFLRAIDLNPIEWSEAMLRAKGGANPIVGQVITDVLQSAHGIMVLLSPDEDAKLKTKFCGLKDKKKSLHKLDGQPRPNVIFEAGLALGAHSDKTILVQVGDIREISDIAGKHMMHLTDDPQSRKQLAQRLRTKLKFKVNTDGDEWLSVGKFDR